MKTSEYFETHAKTREIVLYLLCSFFAMISQVLTRTICDIALRNVTTMVEIWPFERQALGSFISFTLANIMAKTVAYVSNRKATFKANNSVGPSLVIYFVVVIILLIVESIIGTPLMNWYYTVLGGTYQGIHLATDTVDKHFLYQLCGVFSQWSYGIVDSILLFVLDKYVIMRKV